ncbi:MAG: 16S rRNA (cytosine(1402)-N(4))-methyltransferase RsmH [Candidatus Nomurabacteria bacterium]|nr:16S rRNA (cytosine(1402)-N(4))-methyltransferase RsmH [Candidatus Nomurabacteria bacterium]
MRESIHKTVLLNETIEGLGLSRSQALGNSKSLASEIVLDATFGGGGHSKEILKRYPDVKIIALDQDESVSKNLKDPRIFFYNLNFRNISPKLGIGEIPYAQLRGEEQFDAIIFDLGLSSDQLENSGRGFSFMKNEPLLMTMKKNPLPEDLTARDIVNTWGEKNLADIIYGYGEERFSRKIAKGIAEARKKQKIETTFDLVKIIDSSVPGSYRRGRIHYATKTFQALRIAVNDELGALQIGLEKGLKVLKKGGRIAVISFHSLEDRIVKRFYKEKEKEGEVILINKKPIIPREIEIKNNPRSRSAKLRILEKI